MYAKFGKRVCDLVIGVVALPFVLLIIAVLAPFIHFEDKGPVFYNAPRVGLGGRDFKMYKLRSMRVNAPDLVMEDGSTYNGADDPRMTRVGAFMRKTSLDEIPQFFNVLKGDMSFIGPRPFLDYELDALDEKSMRRHDVLPGLSGLAQVSGRNEITVDRKIAKDLEYVDKISFALDAKIFFLTLVKVVFCVDSTPVNKNTVEKYSKGGRR